VIAIGAIDYFTGPEIGLSVAYLIPVAAAGWFGGIPSAVFIALAAGAAWAGANRSVPPWHAAIWLVVYAIVGVLVAMLRRDRELLRAFGMREKALSRTDQVASAPDMRGFLELAGAELHRARAHHRAICAIYVDLDDFKAFNDRSGRAAGDELLEEVGKVMTRVGGDEFAVLAGGLNRKEALETAESLIGKIRKLGVGATAGIAYFVDPPASADDLVRAADDAMHMGKERGKGRVALQNL